MKQLLIAPRPAIDQHWFERLLPLVAAPSEIYAYLRPSQAELDAAREHFYANGMRPSPAQCPDEQHRPLIMQHLQDLEALRRDIAAREPHPVIRQLYLRRIDELLANCHLWLAAAEQDGGSFEHYNSLLYGAPNPRIFGAACTWLRAHARHHTAHKSRGVQEAANDVLRLVPAVPGDTAHIVPHKATFRMLYNVHFMPGGYADTLFAGTGLLPGRVVGQREGDAAIRRTLATIGVPYTIADSPDTFWGIRHAGGQFLRPPGYRLEPEMFQAILLHEVGSHLLERANGLRSPLRLLAVGLDHYEHGNEGRAYLREQLAMGSVGAALQDSGWYFNLAKHLAVSLGTGLHDHPYTFAEIYRTLFALYSLEERRHQPGEQLLADERAHQAAWDLTSRVLAGTDGQGGAYLKDMVYLEGNVRCWRVAQRTPWLIRYGDTGKFDIANPRHLEALRDLGILPGGWMLRARRKTLLWSRGAKEALVLRSKPRRRHR